MTSHRIVRETETYADLLQVARQLCPEPSGSSSCDQEEAVRELAFYTAGLIDEGLVTLDHGPYRGQECVRVDGTTYRVTEEGVVEVWGDGPFNHFLSACWWAHPACGLLLVLFSGPAIAAFPGHLWLGPVMLLSGFTMFLFWAIGDAPIRALFVALSHDGWHPWNGQDHRGELARHLASAVHRGLSEMRARQHPEPGELLSDLPARLEDLGAARTS